MDNKRKRAEQSSISSFFQKRSRTESRDEEVDRLCLRSFALEKTAETSENSALQSQEWSVASFCDNSLAGAPERRSTTDEFPEKPFHPNSNYSFPKDKYSSSCKADWFVIFPFLHYRTTDDSILCHVCMTASNRGVIVNPKEKAFISTGFNNWKNGVHKFREHQKSSVHLYATNTAELWKSGTAVSVQLSSQLLKQQEANKTALMTIISSLRYLARSGLAIRGHADENSNFMLLLEERKRDVPALKVWMERRDKWTSPGIQNEIMEIMAHALQRFLLQEVQEQPFFSIIADGTTDISGKEQLTVCVRYVNDNLQVKELFLGLYCPKETTAASIHQSLSDVLLRLQLDVAKLRGHCFDGAANMSGAYNGVRALIAQRQEKSLYVHCTNHSLDLALQETTRECQMMSDALVHVREVASVIRESAKRREIYGSQNQENEATALSEEEFEQDDEEPMNNLGVKRPLQLLALCPTRWTVRSKALGWFINNYRRVQSTLDRIVEDKNTRAEVRHTVRGYRSQMDSFEFCFGLLVAEKLFKPCEVLASVLQKPTITAAGAKGAAELLRQELQKLRNEFHIVWKIGNEMKETLSLKDPKISRRKKLPARYDYGSPQDSSTPGTALRKQYYESIDRLLALIKDRFEQSGLNELVKLESLVLGSAIEKKRFTEEEVTQNLGIHRTDFDIDLLTTELRMFSNIDLPIRSNVMGKKFPLTTVADIANSFRQQLSAVKSLFPQVTRLLKLCLTVPASSASAERSFSSLKRLKTYLRTTTGQSRLTHLMLLHIHHNELIEIDLESVCHEFVSRNSERRNVFGLK